MRCDNQNFNVFSCLPKEDVVRKARNCVTPNVRRKFHAMPVGCLTNLSHCHIESLEIASAKTTLTALIVGCSRCSMRADSLKKKFT